MSTVRSWRQMVLDADRDFILESTRPIAYEFSNGRKFRQPAGAYTAAPPVVPGNPETLTLDGETLTLDGEELTLTP